MRLRAIRLASIVGSLLACTPAGETSGAPTSPPGVVRVRASFQLAEVDLSIVDAEMSRDLSRWRALEPPPELVFNAGFFDSAGQPIGLAISHGVLLSSRDDRLVGGVLWVRDGVATLSASESYRETDVDFAIQSKPRLVVGARNNIREGSPARAARTALCIRNAGSVVEVVIVAGDVTSALPTLFELGRDLARSGCEEALNLDGGPSTGFAGPNGKGHGPLAGIRHAIVVQRR